MVGNECLRRRCDRPQVGFRVGEYPLVGYRSRDERNRRSAGVEIGEQHSIRLWIRTYVIGGDAGIDESMLAIERDRTRVALPYAEP